MTENMKIAFIYAVQSKIYEYQRPDEVQGLKWQKPTKVIIKTSKIPSDMKGDSATTIQYVPVTHMTTRELLLR